MSGRAWRWVVVAAAVSCLAAACGGQASLDAPRHGILFSFAIEPTTWHGGGDIYSWLPGSPPRLIIKSVSPAVDPQWSPDGTRIAWNMEPPALCKSEADECGKFSCEDQVYVSRGGDAPVRVTPDYVVDGNQGCSTLAAWSPDGSQLLVDRISNTEPSYLAVLSPRTGAVKALRGTANAVDAAWGKPGVAYVKNGRVKLIDPASGASKTLAQIPNGEISALAWSVRSQLAVIEDKRIVVYSSAGRELTRFAAPRPKAPSTGGRLVWSPNGRRLLVCLDPFGGLSAKAHEKLINTRQKRDRYPALVPYLVDRDGRHWQRFAPIELKGKKPGCDGTSWH